MIKNTSSFNSFFLNRTNNRFKPVNHQFSALSRLSCTFKEVVVGNVTVFMSLIVLLILIEISTGPRSINYDDVKWYLIYSLFDLTYFYWIAFRCFPLLINGGKIKTFKLQFVAIGILILYVILSGVFSEVLYSCLGNLKIPQSDFISQTSFIKGILLCTLAFALASAGYARSLESISNEQTEHLRWLENNMLRSQNDSHLMTNVFTSLYERSLHASKELAQSIALLAEISSNTLMETDERGYITIEAEVDYIKKYIQLDSLYKETEAFNNLYIDISGYENLKIPPKILLEPVVNVLKYGDFNCQENIPMVSLKIVDGVLLFRTFNAKRPAHKTCSHKIGLKNLKQRLELNYPGQYVLEVGDGKIFFELSLTIKLC